MESHTESEQQEQSKPRQRMSTTIRCRIRAKQRVSRLLAILMLAIVLIKSPPNRETTTHPTTILPFLSTLCPIALARKTYLVKESIHHFSMVTNKEDDVHSDNSMIRRRPKYHLTTSQRMAALKSGNLFINKTLEEKRRMELGRPASPLTQDPRVQQDWSQDDFDISDRDINKTEYSYDDPEVVPSSIYYTRPSYTKAYCTNGPDDVQHNQLCLFDYILAGEAATTTTVPADWVWDTDRGAWQYNTGFALQYILDQSAQWWVDLTLDRLLSERWILDINQWKFGIFVQAIWQLEYDATEGLPIDSQFCLDLALVSNQLVIKLQREIQLVQCGSIIVGCLDNINPFVLWQKNHIFDMCELSSYTTQTFYEWQVFDTDETGYLWLIPNEYYSSLYESSLCFPSYLNPLRWFYDQKATVWDIWTDLYNIVVSINTKFS